MTFKTALEHFETAQKIAEENDDPAAESIAAGLADLTQTLRVKMEAMNTVLGYIKSKV